MNTEISPSTIAPPAANYAHAVLVENPKRTLHTSGVVPVSPDGSVPQGIRDQTEVVWANIVSILTQASMTVGDIVSITTYVVNSEPLADIMAVRDRVLDGRRVASTLVTVPALARPAWRLEIAVIAAV